MRQGHIAIYYGKGKGKTAVAVGRGMRAIGEGLRVVMIQFMDYHNSKEIALLKKMEPDFRIFRFEKDRTGMDVHDDALDEAVRKELSGEIRNAFNFAKKIVDTGECEMLLLDGVLECVEKGYLQEADLEELVDKRPEYMDFILTGTILPEGMVSRAANIYQIVLEKEGRA
ncbi:cob(I)yrinic acid a,c-diamide adenosyltransferase [Anaerotignum sp.]|nr:cob(I)yrinic acid a,c-diamide adenosyltransferase [Anaerotignum sp.]MBQ7759092.1 cob(I)yrinic acid a,c-diamide adenosyltransferase [Anaerotignum sp.]